MSEPQDVIHSDDAPAGTYEEWRVFGQPGHGYPPYSFVWSRLLTPHMLRPPEVAARAFAARVGQPDRSGLWSPWVDGPHLARRTVTIGEWENQVNEVNEVNDA